MVTKTNDPGRVQEAHTSDTGTAVALTQDPFCAFAKALHSNTALAVNAGARTAATGNPRSSRTRSQDAWTVARAFAVDCRDVVAFYKDVKFAMVRAGTLTVAEQASRCSGGSGDAKRQDAPAVAVSFER